MWALGLTLYFAAMGKNPFDMNSLFGLAQDILDSPAPQVEGDFSPEFSDFVSQCLIKVKMHTQRTIFIIWIFRGLLFLVAVVLSICIPRYRTLSAKSELVYINCFFFFFGK